MNKLISILMCMLLALGFASCSSDIDANDGGKKTSELKITAIIKQDPSQKITLVNQDNTLMPTWDNVDRIYAIWKEGGVIKKSRLMISEINEGVATFRKSEESFPTPSEGTKVHFVCNGETDNVNDFLFNSNNEVELNFARKSRALTFPCQLSGLDKNDLGNLVVMFASATVTDGQLFLEFENQMSVVCVNKFTGLKPNTTYTRFSITSPIKATIRFANDELTLTTDESTCTDVICQKSIDTNAQGETTQPIYFIVPPQQAREHTFTATVADKAKIASNSYWGTLSTPREIGKGKFINLESKRMSQQTKGVWIVKTPEPNETYYAHTNYRSSCRWVQLWEGGPLWAEYNVGAGISNYADVNWYTYSNEIKNKMYSETFPITKTASPYLFNIWGGHYSFKGAKEYIAHASASDVTNTATTLWGNQWRTPTKNELQGLIDNCDWEFLPGSDYDDYKIDCWKVKGRGNYCQNFIYLPLAGNSDQNNGNGNPRYYIQGQMPIYGGWYWSSDTSGSDGYVLYIQGKPILVSTPTAVGHQNKPHGASVRAVINI